jgi:hypothetical protein
MRLHSQRPLEGEKPREPQFTDKHLNERIGTIVRLNAKTASIAVAGSEGHWRVSYGLLRHIVDL